MKSFHQHLSEEYKNDKRISRLLRNYAKTSGMAGPDETPGMAALNNWNNPEFRESPIGKAIISASEQKIKRNRELKKRGVNDAERENIRQADTEIPENRRSRRMAQKLISRRLRLMNKGILSQSTSTKIGNKMLAHGLNPEEQN
jgi:hypothetical protein